MLHKKIWPAIDLLEGKCVRLTEGIYGSEKIYSENPVEIAENFLKAGFENLHIVDLDGARSGRNPNFEIIQKIVQCTDLKVQVGGGIRSMETAQKYLDLGVFRIIIGSAAINIPHFLQKCLETFGKEKIVLGVDVRFSAQILPHQEEIHLNKKFLTHTKNNQGKYEIFTHGWEKNSKIPADEFLAQTSAKNILMTDISRDGTLSGPNTEMYEFFIKMFPDKNFIASGGVSSFEDILALPTIEVVVGKAIYEGKI